LHKGDLHIPVCVFIEEGTMAIASKSLLCASLALFSLVAGSTRADALTINPSSGVFDFGPAFVGTTDTLILDFSWSNGTGQDYVLDALLLSDQLGPFTLTTGLPPPCQPNPGTCTYTLTFTPQALGFVSDTTAPFLAQFTSAICRHP
jgi:hypothetical protein